MMNQKISPAERHLKELSERLDELNELAIKTNFAPHIIEKIEDTLKTIRIIKGIE